jgi:hypothetical protein
MRIDLHIDMSCVPLLAERIYGTDDDIRSILRDTCRSLRDCTDFHVSGFGQDEWPVDVKTDLVVLLEQIPDAIRAIRSGSAANIDFYEQGSERYIELTPDGATYLVTCSSWQKWQPMPATESMGRDDLISMLVAIQTNFMEALFRMTPSLAKNPWIKDWPA